MASVSRAAPSSVTLLASSISRARSAGSVNTVRKSNGSNAPWR